MWRVKKEKSSSVVTTPHAPEARAGSDTTIILPTNSVLLNGSNSTDTDNNISSYSWTKISGPVSFNIVRAQAVQTQVNNLEEGIYLFELKVTDITDLFSKDTVEIIVKAATTPPPSNTKTIKARVLEYGTDAPVAGADITVCTSPLPPFNCVGNYIHLITDNNGEVFFSANQYTYNGVVKNGYFGNIFNPCFVQYFGADSLAEIHTTDSFVVRIVRKTDFTLHIVDSSLRGPLVGNYLTANANFNTCSLEGIIGRSLRRGIDTTIHLLSYYGNTNYVFTVGYDPDDGGFPINVLHQQQSHIANGNNIMVKITY